MTPKITVLIPTLTRNRLLRWSLSSLLSEPKDDVEVIVLDDYHKSDSECESIAKEFGCRYINSGQTKSSGGGWRIPGFAFNIGAKLANGEHLILSSAEAYHPNDTLGQMLAKVGEKKILITRSVRDDKGQFIKQLNLGNTPGDAFIQRMKMLNAALPFFMSVPRKIFIEIGGYDEDFLGVCWDDNDIVHRLTDYGCQREVVNADIVHLFHPRHNYRSSKIMKRWQYNKRLFDQRRDITVRNKDREWGKIDLPPEEPKDQNTQIHSGWGYNNPHDY